MIMEEMNVPAKDIYDDTMKKEVEKKMPEE